MSDVLLLMCFLLAVATVPPLGGRVGRLADLTFRSSYLLVAALAIQVLIISVVFHWPLAVLAPAHVASYASVALFIGRNFRVAGLWVIGLGGLSNLVAIAANGGVMPASLDALRLSGLEAPTGFTNSTSVASPRLAWLGDVFAVPASWPFANTFSIGDIVIVLGAFVLIHTACGSRFFRSVGVTSPT